MFDLEELDLEVVIEGGFGWQIVSLRVVRLGAEQSLQGSIPTTDSTIKLWQGVATVPSDTWNSLQARGFVKICLITNGIYNGGTPTSILRNRLAGFNALHFR